MTRTCSLILGLCLTLAGCPIDGIDGNGNRVDETRDLERFSTVESKGSLDIAIEQGDDYSAVVSIDSNLIHYVDTHVSDGRLVISNT